MKNFIFVLSLLAAAPAWASTGFQCHIKGKSPHQESNYLIFARLDYLTKSEPISGADIQIAKNKWTSISEKDVLKYFHTSRKLNALIRVSHDLKVELEIKLDKHSENGEGKFRLLQETTSAGKARGAKSARILQDKSITCVFDEML